MARNGDKTILDLPEVASLTGNEFVPLVQGGVTKRATVNQIQAEAGGLVPQTTQVIAGTGLEGGGALTGDVTLAIAATGVTAAQYGAATVTPVVTVNAQGQITAISTVTLAPAWGDITATPTTLAGYGITDAQPLDADLTALAALATTGIAARTGAGAWAARTITAGTGISVSNGDGIAGNPTVSLPDVITAGSAGSETSVPVITWDAQGRLTSVAGAAITAGVASVSGTANEITVTGTADVTLALPAALTFTGKTVTGGTYEGVTALTATTITATSFVGITLAMISDAGTAAAQDTGTSGATVPLCNGANTWASRQFFMGNFSAGTTATSTANSNGSTPAYLFSGAGLTGAVQVIRHTTMGTGGGLFTMSATRGTDADSYTALQSGDGIGTFLFSGADGTDYVSAAYIQAQVDGTPGANDMPTRMLFATTADGASSPTERLRITSAGAWGLAGTNYGSSGQAIVSNGSASAPTWQSVGLTGSANTWSGAQTFSSTISVASTITTGGASAATGYTSAGDITLPADRNIRAKNTAKAWINFDGTGTIAARRHFNVSSLTDSGTGVYSVNFTNSIGDNGGAAVSAGSAGARVRADLITNTSIQTGLVSVATSLPGGALSDPQVVTVVIFADNT